MKISDISSILIIKDSNGEWSAFLHRKRPGLEEFFGLSSANLPTPEKALKKVFSLNRIKLPV